MGIPADVLLPGVGMEVAPELVCDGRGISPLWDIGDVPGMTLPCTVLESELAAANPVGVGMGVPAFSVLAGTSFLAIFVIGQSFLRR
jgi:hypothetical protein